MESRCIEARPRFLSAVLPDDSTVPRFKAKDAVRFGYGVRTLDVGVGEHLVIRLSYLNVFPMKLARDQARLWFLECSHLVLIEMVL